MKFLTLPPLLALLALLLPSPLLLSRLAKKQTVIETRAAESGRCSLRVICCCIYGMRRLRLCCSPSPSLSLFSLALPLPLSLCPPRSVCLSLGWLDMPRLSNILDRCAIYVTHLQLFQVPEVEGVHIRMRVSVRVCVLLCSTDHARGRARS